jgi:hypothetical protein
MQQYRSKDHIGPKMPGPFFWLLAGSSAQYVTMNPSVVIIVQISIVGLNME